MFSEAGQKLVASLLGRNEILVFMDDDFIPHFPPGHYTVKSCNGWACVRLFFGRPDSELEDSLGLYELGDLGG